MPMSLAAMFVGNVTTSMPFFIAIFTDKMSVISVAVLLFVFVIIFGLILWLVKQVDARETNLPHATKPVSSLSGTIAYILLVVVALILYIVVLESVSTSWGREHELLL